MTPNDPCPGVWPVWTVWTPGAQVAGFKKRIIEHCYTQNIKALGLMVSKKILVSFSHCKYMGANVPWGGAILNPRGIIGRIYVKHHTALLHTKYTSFGSCSFREEDFFSFVSYYKPIADNDVPRTWPIWTPGAWLSGFIKKITYHCYTQNIKALGLMVSERKAFVYFSHSKYKGANDL